MSIYNKDNVFYKIIHGQIPAKKVYEDDYLLCIHDIRPVAKVHVLLLPKGEYVNFTDFMFRASKDEVFHFFNVVPMIASLLKIGDYKLNTNNGKNAGQEVMHFHYHIISNDIVENIKPSFVEQSVISKSVDNKTNLTLNDAKPKEDDSGGFFGDGMR
jgi:histidine triad (HIT) family protein